MIDSFDSIFSSVTSTALFARNQHDPTSSIVYALPKTAVKRFTQEGPKCALLPQVPETLGDYLEILDGLYTNEESIFWFRGHADLSWKVCPSALRYEREIERNRALGMVAEFKRIQEFRFAKAPSPTDDLRWIQLAQHYGLPTRLRDWTQSPTVALYFACLDQTKDGVILTFNPCDLNRASVKGLKAGVVDANQHPTIISKYLTLDGRKRTQGLKTIALSPVWNSERIILQQGAFTLHGHVFSLDNRQAPSLIAMPILREHKPNLMRQLERIGVAEMFIFPEPEHACKHLKGKITAP